MDPIAFEIIDGVIVLIVVADELFLHLALLLSQLPVVVLDPRSALFGLTFIRLGLFLDLKLF